MGYTPPQLYVNKITGGWSIMPPGATTDDLTIYPNMVDTVSAIKFNGTGAFVIYLGAGQGVYIADNAVSALSMKYTAASNHFEIKSEIDAKDLLLSTTGTGVLKFGTYTAGAAGDSTGYISIKDAAGNTRKLMVQA